MPERQSARLHSRAPHYGGMRKSETPNTRKTYVKLHQRAWDQIRIEWIGGKTAPWLCDKYGMAERTLHARQHREGWTRKALAERAPLPPVAMELDEILEVLSLDDMTPRVAARMALDAAVRLVCAGRMAMANEASRVADRLARTAARLEAVTHDEEDTPSDEAVLAAVRARVVALAAEKAAGAGSGHRTP